MELKRGHPIRRHDDSPDHASGDGMGSHGY
jgi:hypothetical protein